MKCFGKKVLFFLNLDADSYEIKMVWLLGLINMANSLKNEDILSLIINSDESRHIRVLAAYGFKEHLTVEASSEVVTTKIYIKHK